MAFVQIGITSAFNTKEYMCLATDPEGSYKTDCGAGSCVTIIDEAIKEAVGYKVFNGSVWVDL